MAAAPPTCPRRHRVGEGRRRSRRRAQSRPRNHPNPTDSTSPTRIFSQGPACTMPPGRARAAPVTAAAKPWLSLVGMPNRQAAVDHRATAHSPAHRAERAAWVSAPNPAMENSVSATAVLTAVTHISPSRLHRAARQTARRKESAPVHTAVAMALGASVQPLTAATASTSKQVRIVTGSEQIAVSIKTPPAHLTGPGAWICVTGTGRWR